LGGRVRPGDLRGRDGEDEGRDDRERERHRKGEREEREPYDDPEEHHRIEKHWFAGGLPATPERYALARDQWYSLPGAVARPSMDPAVGGPSPSKSQSPERAPPDGNWREQ
jgi:hypothetical protein